RLIDRSLLTHTNHCHSLSITPFKTVFINRFPFVAVSIGFSVNKQVEFGVVYSCLEDKMFTARRGKGAFCNGEPLQVSEQQDIRQSIIATEFGSSRDPEAVDKIFNGLQSILCIPVHGLVLQILQYYGSVLQLLQYCGSVLQILHYYGSALSLLQHCGSVLQILQNYGSVLPLLQ
ncbi:inositol monophosphatase 1-like, partial [Plectropomus leopardus]|uniref:inositol monophosphatase 1-like n=1 Tax=Plectropomus leopardus TaxID=160734 RepID=UPI001C4B0581